MKKNLPLVFLVPFPSPLEAALVSAGAVLALSGLNIAMWSTAGLVLPLASGLLVIFAMVALNLAYGDFVESRSKRPPTERSSRASTSTSRR